VLVLVIRRRLREPESWVRAKQSLAAAAPADELHRQLGDLRELFGDPRWRYHMLIGIALSTAGVMALWGVSFWTPELIRNNVLQDLPLQARHFWASIALLLQNAAAFFGLYGFGRLTARLGRRPAFAVAFLLAYAAIVLVFGFLNQRSQIWWMIPILGFCTFMPFSGYAIYFPELFPTRLRSTGTGFCYNVARYLAALAPLALGQLSAALLAHDPARRAQHLADLTWLSTLGSVDTAFRYAALAVASSLLVGLLILPFAPETRDRPLLD
jgi:MFS family permease